MSRFQPVRFQNDLETDGKVVSRICDPPGQKSFYIPPGDTAKEVYRLTTFFKFPSNAPVNVQHLAGAGFFYTGYKDRVKCFSCGLSVDNWMLGDDVQNPRWHKEVCLMMKGGESGNIPIGAEGAFGRFNRFYHLSNNKNSNLKTKSIGVNGVITSNYQELPSLIPLKDAVNVQQSQAFSSFETTYIKPVFSPISSPYHEQFVKSLDLTQEEHRLRTYGGWPTTQTTVTPKYLARSGFFYLGNADRVQCFSCSGTLRDWDRGDNVFTEHKRHFPHCKMVLGTETHNIPLKNKSTAVAKSPTPKPPSPTSNELIEKFPCLYPSSPHMKKDCFRKLTFDKRWPFQKVKASPKDIAEAGFFYLGDRDRVKCWYCNGGLQNWDYDDEPWTEHAKWFPTCEFLLQNKGPSFVNDIVRKFPNLPRPVLRSGYDVPPPRSSPFSRSNPPPDPVVIDPKVELEKDRKKIETFMDSEIAKLALELGFSRSSLNKTLMKKLQSDDKEFYKTLASLVEDLIPNSDDSDDDLSETSNNETTATSFTGTTQTLEERMKELENERQCKICLDQLAEVVFVPCGHLCSCMSCAGALRKCPICRLPINKAIRTYLS